MAPVPAEINNSDRCVCEKGGSRERKPVFYAAQWLLDDSKEGKRLG